MMSLCMLFSEIITVYSENYKKPINTLYEQNAELMNVNVGATKSTVCFQNI
jgi:hypothetical protein